MRLLRLITICVISGFLFGGCGITGKNYFTVGKDITSGDITDFYYTYENINYNAKYQRYRFYLEDGKYMFFHETRERIDDYGPATEADTTLSGNVELTDGQWEEFFDILKGGKVCAREDTAESGDSGPWLYLYWKNDRSNYQQYSFESYEKQLSFEKYCLELVGRSAV